MEPTSPKGQGSGSPWRYLEVGWRCVSSHGDCADLGLGAAGTELERQVVLPICSPSLPRKRPWETSSTYASEHDPGLWAVSCPLAASMLFDVYVDFKINKQVEIVKGRNWRVSFISLNVFLSKAWSFAIAFFPGFHQKVPTVWKLPFFTGVNFPPCYIYNWDSFLILLASWPFLNSTHEFLRLEMFLE